MKNTRNKVRLTESQLHNVIKESIKQVLSELDWKTYANAADKMSRERGDADYWKEKGEKFPNTISKAANARQRAERLGQASKDAFNRDYGYKRGEWLDDDYAEVGMGGDFGYTDEFAPHAAAWKHDGVALKKRFPHGVYTNERTPEELESIFLFGIVSHDSIGKETKVEVIFANGVGGFSEYFNTEDLINIKDIMF